MTGLFEMLGALAHLDEEIDRLQGQRADYTGQLESLAHDWHKRFPESPQTPSHLHRLACSACTFRYSGVTETEIRFGTTCTWCGQDAGSGAGISIIWFAQALREMSTS